jgi:hypothetical protein
MKRYLGLTEQEMSENEVLFSEERGDAEVATVDAPNLGGVGLSVGGVQSDIEGLGPAPEAGAPAAGPDGVGAAGAQASQPAL